MRAVGLMSGTSLDGVDAALIETDGESVFAMGGRLTRAYEPDFRARLRGLLGRPDAPETAGLATELAEEHAAIVADLAASAGIPLDSIDVIGFHGQTIDHRPAQGRPGVGRTWQIGDADRLAAMTGRPVVYDFRSADVAAGGEGAPFVPLFHQALARDLGAPLAVLNLGGVANVTWIGDLAIAALDTGPGMALVDDWVLRESGRPFDDDGLLVARGRVDMAVVDRLLADPWFDRPPPKSLDRNHFAWLSEAVAGADLADGAATLADCSAAAVAAAVRLLPASPVRWLVAGGGRRNLGLLARLRVRLGVPVEPVESVGWDGDALEAQAFAYLAVRSLRGLPLSLPETTGVPHPMTGGRLAGA